MYAKPENQPFLENQYKKEYERTDLDSYTNKIYLAYFNSSTTRTMNI
jgi:hypothetical protein